MGSDPLNFVPDFSQTNILSLLSSHLFDTEATPAARLRVPIYRFSSIPSRNREKKGDRIEKQSHTMLSQTRVVLNVVNRDKLMDACED